MALQIPLLRMGSPYYSLDTVAVPHFQSGEPVAQLSLANPGLIARDLRSSRAAKAALEAIPARDLLAICKRAAELFCSGTLPLGETRQSAGQYVAQLSASTGMPEVLVRKNMDKITLVLEEMEAVIGGLTRGLDIRIFDSGWMKQNDRPINFLCETDNLGVVLPSNSPGVHSLWIQALAMKVPVVLKPGSQEPWTPFRIAQAFFAAGLPGEAIGYYPTSHAGGSEILMRTGRSMVFGDKNTVAPWRKDRRVQIHGPGWSKVVIGQDKIGEWRSCLDVIEVSAIENGGRSCINASGVWVPAQGREIADALAQRFAAVQPRGIEDPQARIAAFTNKNLAYRLNEMIDNLLRQPGAEDMTARYRPEGRLVEFEGSVFLLPTVVFCEDDQHPLAHAEYLFPFISVVEVPQQTKKKKIPQLGICRK